MSLKRNFITILFIINLLLACMILVKRFREKFNVAAIIDTANKNKIHIASKVKVNSSSSQENLKNAELFIDGDLEIGKSGNFQDPELCLGNNCFKAEKLNEFVSYHIPYEVFETDSDLTNNVPDKLCYDIDKQPYCITGDHLRVLNGDQPVYIAGPNDKFNEGSFHEEGHLKQTIGPGSQYYYDINDNYYEKEGKKHKEYIPPYQNPCGGLICNNKRLYKKMQLNDQNYINSTGVTKVPYFYNLNKITSGVTDNMLDSINIDRKIEPCHNGEQACNGDGILQMIKMPIHKTKGHHFDSNLAHSHSGENNQNNELMNIAAVNFMPVGFTGSKDNINVRDRVKYTLRPGDDTNLQCFSF